MPAFQSFLMRKPPRTRCLLNFEEATVGSVVCAATGETFNVDADPTPPIISTSGKFGQALNVAGSPGDGSGKGILRSTNASTSWDLLSDPVDWTIACWVQLTGALDAGAADGLVYIQCDPYDSNTNISLELIGGGTPTVRGHVPSSGTLLTSEIANFTVDTDWHFVVYARVGNALYLSVDGAAASGSGIGSAAYRHPAGARRVEVGNNYTNTAARRLPGLVDAIQIIEGLEYDAINGFTVPTTAPVMK